jgi:hypothetical protein
MKAIPKSDSLNIYILNTKGECMGENTLLPGGQGENTLLPGGQLYHGGEQCLIIV